MLTWVEDEKKFYNLGTKAYNVREEELKTTYL